VTERFSYFRDEGTISRRDNATEAESVFHDVAGAWTPTAITFHATALTRAEAEELTPDGADLEADTLDVDVPGARYGYGQLRPGQ
jgi:hypothetical protein